VIGGLDLLVGQAGRQVELMTGCPIAPVEAMRAAGVAALASRRPSPQPS
jgi:shikimate dehydrogenase